MPELWGGPFFSRAEEEEGSDMQSLDEGAAAVCVCSVRSSGYSAPDEKEEKKKGAWGEW